MVPQNLEMPAISEPQGLGRACYRSLVPTIHSTASQPEKWCFSHSVSPEFLSHIQEGEHSREELYLFIFNFYFLIYIENLFGPSLQIAMQEHRFKLA